MNKREMVRLVETCVLTCQATINANAADAEPAISEDEARTLVGLEFRKHIATITLDVCNKASTEELTAEDLVHTEPPKKVKKKKEDAETPETVDAS